jgi:ATP-binding protein involved in chromosome partitioning
MGSLPKSLPAPDLVDAIRERLSRVIDPELGLDIVSLGMVGKIAISEGGIAEISVALTTPSCPLRSQIETDVTNAVTSMEGIDGITLTIGQLDPEAKSALMDRARRHAQENPSMTTIPSTARILGIASGKGGVGKSSVTANLAVALARQGLRVGVLDADIWGFSIPRFLGIDGPLEARDKKMVPKKISIGTGSIAVLSMGFLSGEDQAIMWRGLILNRAVQQFIEDAHWDEIDYLLIDLPPGTGDVQMGLARMLPRTELLIVTTPPLAAQQVATRAADMAQRGNLRVAGVLENMSDFTCEHGTSYALFGSGGGERLANSLGVPFIGSIPLDPQIVDGGDTGKPVALGDTATSRQIQEIARRITTEIAPLNDAQGCTARLLAALDEAASSPSAS